MVSDPWLVSLPKAEIHVHLEGSLDDDFVAAAAARAGMELPDRAQVHDLAQLLDELRRAGVLISLNTDDPALLGTDLISEYRTCAQAFGWSEDTLCAVARTSLEAAFASPALKSGLLRDLQEFASATTPDESGPGETPIQGGSPAEAG